MLTSQARRTGPGRHGDHRRDPRPRRHQAGCPHGPAASSAWRRSPAPPARQRIALSATQRPLDEMARFLGGTVNVTVARPVTIVDAGAQGARRSGGGARRRHGPPQGWSKGQRPWPPAGALHLAVDVPPARSLTAGTARRWCSSTPGAWPSAWHPLSPAADAEDRAGGVPDHVDEQAGTPTTPGASGEDEARASVRRTTALISSVVTLEIQDELKPGDPLGARGHAPAWASTWGRSTSSSRPRSLAGRPASSASAGPGTRSASPVEVASSRSMVDLLPGHGGGATHEAGPSSSRVPAQPASTCWRSRSWRWCALDEWHRSTTSRAVAGGRPPSPRSPTRCCTSVLDLLAGRYPSEEFASCGPAVRVWDRRTGSSGAVPGPSASPSPAAGHHPRPGPLRRLPPRRHRGSASSTRRWSTRAGPARPSCSAPPPGASRRSRPSGSSSRRRRASRGRCRSGTATAPAAARAGPGDRCLHPRAAARHQDADHGRLPSATGSTRWRPTTSLALPRRADRGHGRRARRPHDRRRALPRRDRRLAGLHPLALRRPGPRPVGHGPAGAAWPTSGASRSSSCGATTASPCACPRPIDDLPLDELLIDPEDDRRAGHGPAAQHRAVRLPLPGVRGPGPAPAPPPARPAHPAVAAAPAGGRPPAGRRPLPDVPASCWRRPASACNDVFDLPALRRGAGRPALAGRAGRRRSRRQQASPFAQSLLFGWIAVYMYEGDAPLAERRAAALALDRDLLPRPARRRGAARAARRRRAGRGSSCEAAALTPTAARARDADELHDLLRGPRAAPADELDAARRRRRRRRVERLRSSSWSRAPRGPSAVGVAGEERVAAAEDAARLRDALGVRPARRACRRRSPTRSSGPLVDLVARYARTHGPFLTARGGRPARRRGPSRSAAPLEALAAEGRVVRGEFRPDGVEREWCDDEVLRQLRRRSLAALRKEVEPVDGRRPWPGSCPAWQGVGVPRRGIDGLVEVLGRSRARRCRRRCSRPTCSRPAWTATARPTSTPCARAGEVVWVGAGAHRRRRRPGAARLPRPGSACSCPPGRRARPTAPSTTPCATHLAAAGRLVLARPASARRPTRASPTTTPPCSPRCGTWSGPARSPTTRSPRCGPSSARPGDGAAGRRRRASVGPGPVASPGSARPRPPAGGRWSPRCVEPAPSRHRGGPRPGPAAARALRRAHPRGGPGRGGRGRLRRRLPGAARPWRTGARCGGATSSPASGRPSSPCPARSTACARAGDGRPATTDGAELPVLAATDPAQPYGAALPWPETAGRPGRRARPAPTWSSSTASPPSTSSGAAKRLVTFPGRRRGALGPRRCSRW